MAGAGSRDAARLELILELIDHIERRLMGMTLPRFAQDRDEVDSPPIASPRSARRPTGSLAN